MQAAVVGGVKARLAQHGLRLAAPAIAGNHGRANRAAIGIDPDQLDLEPIGLAAQIIAQQARRLVEIDDQDVYIAIVVEVAEGAAPARPRLGYGVAGLFK